MRICIRTSKSGCTYVVRIFVEASFDELLELFGVASGQLRRIVFGNEEQNPHWVHVRVWRLTLSQLDGRDPERPETAIFSLNQGFNPQRIIFLRGNSWIKDLDIFKRRRNTS